MYNLSTVLTASDGYNFTMSSANATVTCTSATAKFEFNRVENIDISGMTFQGCRNTAISMSWVESASIMRSTFTGNQALTSGSSRNRGCLYIFSSLVVISESEFKNNRAYYSGGAIYTRLSTVRIEISQFSYNRQEYSGYGNGGGAICASYSNITVNGSVFTYNNARRSGGAIYYKYKKQLNKIEV
jgi:predicted outer membrane repeat protein